MSWSDAIEMSIFIVLLTIFMVGSIIITKGWFLIVIIVILLLACVIRYID